ncbi:MAG: 3-methyl-2-oxobutanoate hydroxymethyltransferase [Acidimicrobiia bacterium]
MEDTTPRKKVTAPSILARKGGPRIKMVTAYDYPTAVIADRAGADVILVGDSLANAVLGYEDTLSVDLDVMIHHTAAVARAQTAALVVGDMPWLSYHVSVPDAVSNAGRLVREGGAETVKVEGGRKRLDVVKGILDAEIPVMGHLGLTPQSVHAMGGYRVQGKATEAAQEMIRDAVALAEAGVFAIVLEGVPTLVGEIITKEISVPTIGIGAGPHCDGQVLVFHDVLGFHDGHIPKFVRQYANLQDQAIEALADYFTDLEKGTFPSEDESYSMSEEAARALLRDEPQGDPFDAF